MASGIQTCSQRVCSSTTGHWVGWAAGEVLWIEPFSVGVAIGRALQPFPRSKRSRHVSAHSAFQLGLSTLEGRMRLERRRGAPASDVLLTLPSSRAGAGKPQLAQAELQGGALEPQARCRTVGPAEHPARLL